MCANLWRGLLFQVGLCKLRVWGLDMSSVKKLTATQKDGPLSTPRGLILV